MTLLQERLFAMQDKQYAAFQSKLTPGRRGNEIWKNGIKRQLLLLCCIIKRRIYDFTSRKTVRHAG